jgi:myo-inositol-1(or 4)-monophosphatase
MNEITFIETFLKANLEYTLEKYQDRDTITVTSKSDATDLLTEVDLTLQKRAIDQIGENFPGDTIVAEEGTYNRFPDDPNVRCWVMDPIDGTSNFVRGMFPLFGISLAFAMGGESVAGGVLFPGTGDLLLAERGSGATLNGKPVRVSDIQSLAEARVDLDFSGLSDRRAMLDRASDIILGTGVLRCHGSAVCSIAQIATGHVDGYVHMTLNPWDYAAAQLLVEEAGGLATRHDGTPLKLFDNRKGVVISNGAVHEELLSKLRGG